MLIYTLDVGNGSTSGRPGGQGTTVTEHLAKLLKEFAMPVVRILSDLKTLRDSLEGTVVGLLSHIIWIAGITSLILK